MRLNQIRNTALVLFLATDICVTPLLAQTCNISSANCSQSALQNCLSTATNVNISGCTLTGVSLSIPNNVTVNVTLDQGSNVQATWNANSSNTTLVVNGVTVINQNNASPNFTTLNTTYGGSLSAMLAALPIEMVRFDAKLVDAEAALLTWETAREIDNAGYELLWSTNARDWSSIASVKPSSASSEHVQSYTFRHDNPAKGLNYYQILQTDLNGAEWLSPIRSINKSNARLDAVAIYPNPAQTTIQLSNLVTDDLTYTIFDVFGRVVRQEQELDGATQIDISELQAGNYQLLLSDGAEHSQMVLSIVK